MRGNLVLVGFMGSGKSAVGARVAEALGLTFVDLDQRIEELTGMSIDAIFEQQGEARFRALENASLARALAERRCVVAVGGGAVMDDANWALVRDGNIVVRLKASPAATLARLGGGEGRPLAGGGGLREDPDLRARLMRLADTRESRYAEAAHQVDTTGRSVDDVAAEVAAIATDAGMGQPATDRSAS